MQSEAKVHEGTVEIPSSIGDALRLRNGDTIVFDTEQDVVHLRVRQRASFRDFVCLAGNASEGRSIEQLVAEERERRGY